MDSVSIVVSVDWVPCEACRHDRIINLLAMQELFLLNLLPDGRVSICSLEEDLALLHHASVAAHAARVATAAVLAVCVIVDCEDSHSLLVLERQVLGDLIKLTGLEGLVSHLAEPFAGGLSQDQVACLVPAQESIWNWKIIREKVECTYNTEKRKKTAGMAIKTPNALLYLCHGCSSRFSSAA